MLAGSHGLYEIGDTLFSTVEPGATVFDVGVMVASQLVHPECQLFADLSSAAVEQPIREGAQDPLLDDSSANVRADRSSAHACCWGRRSSDGDAFGSCGRAMSAATNLAQCNHIPRKT